MTNKVQIATPEAQPDGSIINVVSVRDMTPEEISEQEARAAEATVWHPSDFPLADWQLRKGLVLNGYSIDAIEATIKAIPDQAERELRWNAWDRPAVIHWDSPATQEFMEWLGIPPAYAEDMWMAAKDYTL